MFHMKARSMESFLRYSQASKARWANISPEERSKRMSAVAKDSWKGKSEAYKRDRILAMVNARKQKNAKQGDGKDIKTQENGQG